MTKELESAAAKAAAKICGQGQCQAPYPCGHTNRVGGLPPITAKTGCPLAKYSIKPSTDPRPWYERPRSETEITEDDLFALCATCEHATVEVTDGEMSAKRVNFHNVCADCPVLSAQDALSEGAAEAAGS